MIVGCFERGACLLSLSLGCLVGIVADLVPSVARSCDQLVMASLPDVQCGIDPTKALDIDDGLSAPWKSNAACVMFSDTGLEGHGKRQTRQRKLGR